MNFYRKMKIFTLKKKTIIRKNNKNYKFID